MQRVPSLEDDDVSAQLRARILRASSFERIVTARCAKAWTRRKWNSVENPTPDSNLNGEYGWNFLNQVRGDVNFKRSPVINHCRDTQRGTIQERPELGVHGVLVKPRVAKRLHAEVGRLTQTPWHNDWCIHKPVRQSIPHSPGRAVMPGEDCI